MGGPEGNWTRHTYGNSYRYNEGKLIKVERGSGPQQILQVTEQRYQWPLPGTPFASRLGSTQQGRTAGFTSEYLRPLLETVITRDGANFSSRHTSLDGLGRPLTTVAASSLGYKRTETLQYHDNTSRWVLGQIARRTNVETGAELERTVFDPSTALPLEKYEFAQRRMQLGYYADGQVESVTDGNGNITIASNWFRGTPQVIGHADGTTVSAVVDALGRVTRTTDENGFSSTYSYDAMGRLAGRTYPGGDTVAWTPVTRVFARVGAQYGLPADHWRLTETEGNRRRRVHFDAFWRPVLEEEQDLQDAQSLTQVVTRYDRLGRKVFVSYPTRGVSDVSAALTGTTSRYDSLDRLVQTRQDSELGVLTTTVNYLAGFQRETINPRGFATREQFQAWDTPDQSLPVRIDAPEGVSTVITRNVFGNPVEISRSGPDR